MGGLLRFLRTSASSPSAEREPSCAHSVAARPAKYGIMPPQWCVMMRIFTHHCGGMIPYFAGRAETLWAQLGSRSVDGEETEVLKRLQKPPIEYFKMFYGDTVL